MLPINTILGDLSILEIYEFYNMPVLFACQNRTGHIYIASWIDETETDNTWLYTPLSLSRFSQLRKRELDLHYAFVQPEDGFVLKVTVSKADAHKAHIEPIPQDHLDESWAPLPGDYLDIHALPRIIWDHVDQRSGTGKILISALIVEPAPMVQV
jgi:hypothetical protein